MGAPIPQSVKDRVLQDYTVHGVTMTELMAKYSLSQSSVFRIIHGDKRVKKSSVSTSDVISETVNDSIVAPIKVSGEEIDEAIRMVKDAMTAESADEVKQVEAAKIEDETPTDDENWQKPEFNEAKDEVEIDRRLSEFAQCGDAVAFVDLMAHAALKNSLAEFKPNDNGIFEIRLAEGKYTQKIYDALQVIRGLRYLVNMGVMSEDLYYNTIAEKVKEIR